jgi:hypothetical protein
MRSAPTTLSYFSANVFLPDVLGILKEAGPVGEITSKTNRTVWTFTSSDLLSHMLFRFKSVN